MTNSHPIHYKGRDYKSLAAFCAEHGIKYTTARLHLQQGKSIDEIMALQGTLPPKNTIKHNSRRGEPCSYAGIEFPSIAVAAESLGFSEYTVYRIKRERRVDATTAIAILLDGDDGKYPRVHPDAKTMRRACVINGEYFSSKAEALQRFGLPYQTVKSRMVREGISFQEAVMRGHAEKRAVTAAQTMWPQTQWTTHEKGCVHMEILTQIESMLTEEGFTVYQHFDEDTQISGLSVFRSLLTVSDPTEIFITADKAGTQCYSTLEFHIPALVEFDKPLDDKARLDILTKLNEISMQYTGATASLSGNTIHTTWSISMYRQRIQVRLLLRAFYQFLGTSSYIWQLFQNQ